MDTKRNRIFKILLLSVVFIFIVVLMSFATSDLSADSHGTRAPGDYKGPEYCQQPGCHVDIYDSWITSPHASAWNTLNASPEKKEWCETCHTTGANEPEHNGFDPATDQPEYLKNVTCESCHGPDPMSLADSSDATDYDAAVCGTCHRTAQFDGQSKTYHPYYDEWSNSSHALSLTAQGGLVATDPSCQGCHVAQVAIAENFEGGTAERPVKDPQPIVCAVCHDPHGSSNENQLRKPIEEICSTCHTVGSPLPGEVIRHPQSSMRTGISGIDVSKVPRLEFMRDALCSDCHMYSTGPPQNITGHTFRPKMEACVSCHAADSRTFPITVDQASSAVNSWQSITLERLLSTESNLTLAKNAIDNAHLYHFSDQVLNTAQNLYDDANYSYSFVIADRSQGAHNLPYALALLDFANESSQGIIDMLTPGKVVGKIVDQDGEDVVGASVLLNGEQIAVSGSGGSFAIDIAPGTYTFKIKKDGSTIGSVENVEVLYRDTTDLGTISTEPTQGGLELMILVAVLIIIVVVIVVVYFVRFKPPKENEKPDEE
ncbi:MAG: ammonia-forming cytochrome c nitrite reductase subunit c552 [Thermoplasmata archaeon]|nr:ammonia-forming cytochrome c nitrite reductase subunit c552 [Thermoplasmata archaeon]